MNWAALESSLDPDPLFHIERPDGRKELTELQRVRMLLKLVRERAPAVHVHAIPNAAKRGLKAQRQAKAEGMRAGVFDLCFTWAGGSAAWVEMKGYDAAGRAGKLSAAQIDWGNAHFRMGHDVASFYSPEKALEWLRGCGAPVMGSVTA